MGSCVYGKVFLGFCEPVREQTQMAKRIFNNLAWLEWIEFLRANQDAIMGEVDVVEEEEQGRPTRAPQVPRTRAETVQVAFPEWSAEEVRAALVVEDEIVPRFLDGRLTDLIFAGDAGWWAEKAAPL